MEIRNHRFILTTIKNTIFKIKSKKARKAHLIYSYTLELKQIDRCALLCKLSLLPFYYQLAWTHSTRYIYQVSPVITKIITKETCVLMVGGGTTCNFFFTSRKLK